MEEGAAIYRKIRIKICRSNEKNIKSPLEHHSNNCFGPDILMHAKITG